MKYKTAPFFLAGTLCIDFCNTLEHCEPPQRDLIPDYAAALRWGQDAGILPSDYPATSATGKRSIARVVKTRSLLIRLLAPFTRSDMPAVSDLAAFNALSQKVSAKMKVVHTSEGYTLVCGADDPVEKILCAVVRSAADLLLSNKFEKVKACEECGWWFYDRSNNHLRRWCGMRVCGNRAKARRHYARVRENKAAKA